MLFDHLQTAKMVLLTERVTQNTNAAAVLNQALERCKQLQENHNVNLDLFLNGHLEPRLKAVAATNLSELGRRSVGSLWCATFKPLTRLPLIAFPTPRHAGFGMLRSRTRTWTDNNGPIDQIC